MSAEDELVYSTKRETFERKMAEKATDEESRKVHDALANHHAKIIKPIKVDRP